MYSKSLLLFKRLSQEPSRADMLCVISRRADLVNTRQNILLQLKNGFTSGAGSFMASR